ncbi:MAG: PaaI family thioesterase [Halioglobus sp.]
MSDKNTLYAAYASKEVGPPADEYWVQRRRVATLFRALQERVQTTGHGVAELQALGDGLSAQLNALADEPRLEGRSAWADAEGFGDWGAFQTEVTPVIGPSSPLSPGLSIWFEEDKAHAVVTFSWMYEGADHIVHGGWIAAVFDELLGTAQILSGRSGMTGHLITRYHKPTPLNKELRMEARVVSVEDRKITMSGELWADDVMTASCEGLFVVPGGTPVSRGFGTHDGGVVNE